MSQLNVSNGKNEISHSIILNDKEEPTLINLTHNEREYSFRIRGRKVQESGRDTIKFKVMLAESYVIGSNQELEARRADYQFAYNKAQEIIDNLAKQDHDSTTNT